MKLSAEGVKQKPMKSRQSNPFPIVYFGNDWAAENRTSSHHIARWLGERHSLLYVDSPGLRAPKSSGRDLRKIWHKLRLAFAKPKRQGSSIYQITVPQVPFRRLPGVRVANRLFASWMVRRAMRRVGIDHPLLWFATPDMSLLAGCLGERGLVYYCIDDYARLPDVDGREVARMDRELTVRADQVFVSSPALLPDKKALNATTEYSPHGVDVAMFGKALDASLPVPESTRQLGRPIIGFFGLIEAWLDTDLLAWLGEQRPNWTFLMIGRVATDVNRLRELPNFVFPGTQPYETLPSWAKAFDVAIIPFRQNELVRSVNPLKLREYLATGKPVVSVPMPEVDRFAEYVGIGRTREEFLNQLEDAIHHDTTEKQSRRMHCVSGMSWDGRMREVMAIVAERVCKGSK